MALASYLKKTTSEALIDYCRLPLEPFMKSNRLLSVSKHSLFGPPVWEPNTACAEQAVQPDLSLLENVHRATIDDIDAIDARSLDLLTFGAFNDD